MSAATPWSRAEPTASTRRSRALSRVASRLRGPLGLPVDFVAAALSMLLGHALSPVFRGPLLQGQPREAALVYAAAFVGLAWALGLYDPRVVVRRTTLLLHGVLGVAFALAITLGFFYVTAYRPIGRWAVTYAGAFTFLFLFASREIVRRLPLRRRQVLFVGDGPLSHTIEDVLRKDGHPLYEAASRQRPDFQELRAWCAEAEVDEIVVPSASPALETLLQPVLSCLPLGCRVRSEADFYEEAMSALPVRHVSTEWMLDRGWDTSDPLSEAGKRAIDLALAAVLLVLAAPLIVLTALALALAGGGPVLYRQVRTGRYGRPFRMLKFRTMRVNAETNGAQWSDPNDARQTSLGRVLRRTRVDELPQLVNILRGDMSFVGPRPERPEFVAELEKALPYYAWRHRVRPGLTGWAQINCPYGSSVGDACRKLEYDLYYIRHYSTAVDLSIVLRTLAAPMRGAR